MNIYEQVKYVNGSICFLSKIKKQFWKKLMRLSKKFALKSQLIKSFEITSSNMAVSPSFPLFPPYFGTDPAGLFCVHIFLRPCRAEVLP